MTNPRMTNARTAFGYSSFGVIHHSESVILIPLPLWPLCAPPSLCFRTLRITEHAEDTEATENKNECDHPPNGLEWLTHRRCVERDPRRSRWALLFVSCAKGRHLQIRH